MGPLRVWFSKRQFRVHFKVGYTSPQDAVANFTAWVFQPLREAFSLTPCSNGYVIPSVPALFNGCSPFAIIWRIPGIIIDSFETEASPISVCFGPLKKCRKTASPFLASVYSTSSIVNKRRVLWLMASTYHSSPNVSYPGIVTWIYSFGLRQGGAIFPLLAVTASHVAIFNVGQSVNTNTSAFAPALYCEKEIRCLGRCGHVIEKPSRKFEFSKSLFWIREWFSSSIDEFKEYFRIVVECSHGRITPIKCVGLGAVAVSRSFRPAFAL